MDNILEYENLIYKMISQYKSFDKEDLYQVAMMGLMKAQKNYKESENTKFSTYAYYYILGEINNYITASNPVKVSRDLLRLNRSNETEIKKGTDNRGVIDIFRRTIRKNRRSKPSN